MNFFKKRILIFSTILLSTTYVNAFVGLGGVESFHQKGLEKGNTKFSVALFSSKPDEGDSRIALNTQLGKLLTTDIEVLTGLSVSTSNGDTNYDLSGGINYYFLKTETLTPFIGSQLGFSSSTNSASDSSFSDSIYLGAHKFLNERTAVTPETGLQFVDFTDYQEVYFNIYLTFFFDSL